MIWFILAELCICEQHTFSGMWDEVGVLTRWALPHPLPSFAFAAACFLSVWDLGVREIVLISRAGSAYTFLCRGS
mgnify:FL=1